MAHWDLTGMKVLGRYLNEFEVSGQVTSSRVKYGGKVCHQVVLDAPIQVYGAIRERVTLDEDEVVIVHE